MSKAKITIKVVDESGEALSDVDVKVGYQFSSSSGTKVKTDMGKTGLSGSFTSAGATNGHVSFTASKPGYYRSQGVYDFFDKEGFSWMPRNPEVKIVIRDIQNPVPMHARNTLKSPVEIPVLDKDVGFDLVEFDWVSPYGKGKSSDFVFNLQRNYLNRYDYEAQLSLQFSNVHDGVVEVSQNKIFANSDFKSFREAPQNGYRNKIIMKIVSNKDGIIKTNINNSDYIFRVRSEEKNNKYDRSMHGKIHGGIDFGVIRTETAYIGFKYFLNPDYSRNLEYDQSRNLFQNLKSFEEVKLY